MTRREWGQLSHGLSSTRDAPCCNPPEHTCCSPTHSLCDSSKEQNRDWLWDCGDDRSQRARGRVQTRLCSRVARALAQARPGHREQVRPRGTQEPWTGALLNRPASLEALR